VSNLKHLLAVFAAVAIILSSQAAHATHFRYGNLSHTIPDPDSAPRSVKFEIVSAFRTSYTTGFDISLRFGDGALTPPHPGFKRYKSRAKSGTLLQVAFGGVPTSPRWHLVRRRAGIEIPTAAPGAAFAPRPHGEATPPRNAAGRHPAPDRER
jgi:hypothetical protein